MLFPCLRFFLNLDVTFFFSAAHSAEDSLGKTSMGSAFSGGKRDEVYASLDLTFSTIGTVCSFIVLYLIHRLRLKNGHILLIWTMTIFQSVYDLTLFFATVNVGGLQFQCAAQCVNQFGGIVSSLISNVIAFVSFYVVMYGKIIDIRKNYLLVLFVVTLPAWVVLIVMSMSCTAHYSYLKPIASTGMYFYFRAASIWFNFLICTATASQIYFKRANEKKLSSAEKALRKLALRLIYYPIVQAFSRSAVSWYEIEYGYNFDPKHTSQSQFIGEIFTAILTPSASYGYLAIFLLMQPQALECLKCLIQRRMFVMKKSTALIDNRGTINSVKKSEASHDTFNTIHSNGNASSHHGSTVSEADNLPSYGVEAFSCLTEESLDDMDDDELFHVVSSRHSINNISVELRLTNASEISHL